MGAKSARNLCFRCANGLEGAYFGKYGLERRSRQRITLFYPLKGERSVRCSESFRTNAWL
jgi:hypothetical protein